MSHAYAEQVRKALARQYTPAPEIDHALSRVFIAEEMAQIFFDVDAGELAAALPPSWEDARYGFQLIADYVNNLQAIYFKELRRISAR